MITLHLTFTLDMATIEQAVALLAWKVYQMRRSAGRDTADDGEAV